MNTPQAELYQRINDFSFDPPGTRRSFGRRLAEENGWDAAFARRVLDEYKKFAFLAVVAGHPVAPSDAVDQAWHLHLLYTRSYWEHFCPEVLGRPLHHGPSRGDPAERRSFHDWYAQTLASYERFFGH